MFSFIQTQKSKIITATLIVISVALNYECRKDKYAVPDPVSSNSVSNCDTANITYTNSIKVIFDSNCINCHNASNPSGGWALDTYNSSKTCAQSGRLLGAVEWLSGYSAMPKGGNKLSDCDIAKIQKWINAGMPN